MLKKITSFGMKHGLPDPQPYTVTIDIRRMFRNPYRDKTLRYLSGLDERVVLDVMGSENFSQMIEHIRQQITAPGVERAYIGCTGGKHRSVAVAELLGKELGVLVTHRDINLP
jgi:UPF0042 nucleotide-binding protein